MLGHTPRDLVPLSMVKAFHLHIWGSRVARKVTFLNHYNFPAAASTLNLLCL
jgi:hypothetical protein